MGIAEAGRLREHMRRILRAVQLNGIRPDNLGDYFAGLGILAAASREWPTIRGCWTSDHFVLLDAGLDRERLEHYLRERWKPTAYERWWVPAQKKDTAAGTDNNIQAARSVETVQRVKLLDCHIAGSGKNSFNPVFGSGGNIGRRDLQVPSQESRDKRIHEDSLAWLRHTLYSEGMPVFPELSSVGTWFVYANKTFNSGQKWYREGRMSPWSFLLAMEGALLLRGGVGKRLGSHAKPYAVFPFVSGAASPADEGEVGMAPKGEFWAPLWNAPANLAEVNGLLERGMARIGNRAARSPHEFAIAALAAGVDAGVSSFVRFSLRQTTSSQVFEAIPKSHIDVNREGRDASLVQPLLAWTERLPPDPRDKKQKGKFQGLRGPIEECIIALAERPGEAEVWRAALLVLAGTQDRIDKNGMLRERCIAIPWLNDKWFDKAWPEPTPELELARAIASIGADTQTPIQCNIFGVEVRGKGIYFVQKKRPQHVVWHGGEPVRMLAGVLERRLIDTLAGGELPLLGSRPCAVGVVQAFLSLDIDCEVVARWIPPLSLINWGKRTASEDRRTGPDEHSLYGLFRPLFHPERLQISGEDLLRPKPLPRPVTARTLLNLIRQEAWQEALRLASNRYLAAGRSVVEMPTDVRADGDLIAASLLVPVESDEVVRQLRRWLKPSKRSGN
jgi:CRISPR-associated protein Csx17